MKLLYAWKKETSLYRSERGWKRVVSIDAAREDGRGRQKEEGDSRMFSRQPPNNECEGRSFFGSTGAKTHVKGKEKEQK